MTDKKDVDQRAKEARREASRLKKQAAQAEQAADKLLSVAGEHATGFMTFVREQGVVGLAVGLAIGAAAGATVKQIVEGFINPMINLLVGSQEGLMAATWTVQVGEREAVFAWGAVLSSVITLLATALVIYWLVKVAKLDRIDKKKS